MMSNNFNVIVLSKIKCYLINLQENFFENGRRSVKRIATIWEKIQNSSASEERVFRTDWTVRVGETSLQSLIT